MTTMASQITILTVVYTTVYSDAYQRKHQTSASLAFVWGIHQDRWIPTTKGQLRGKCFHLMTSSWSWRPLLGLVPWCHDDVIYWKHIPRNWPIVREIHPSPVDSPHKGKWRGLLIFSLVCVWPNGYANYRDAGNLRRHRGHYDVTVMVISLSQPTVSHFKIMYKDISSTALLSSNILQLLDKDGRKLGQYSQQCLVVWDPFN